MEKKVKRTKASSMKNRRMVPRTKSSVRLIRRVAPMAGPDFVNDLREMNEGLAEQKAEGAGDGGGGVGAGASVDTTAGFKS